MASRSAVVDDGVVSSFGVVSCVHEKGVLGGRFSGETLWYYRTFCRAFLKDKKQKKAKEEKNGENMDKGVISSILRMQFFR